MKAIVEYEGVKIHLEGGYQDVIKVLEALKPNLLVKVKPLPPQDTIIPTYPDWILPIKPSTTPSYPIWPQGTVICTNYKELPCFNIPFVSSQWTNDVTPTTSVVTSSFSGPKA